MQDYLLTSCTLFLEDMQEYRRRESGRESSHWFARVGRRRPAVGIHWQVNDSVTGPETDRPGFGYGEMANERNEKTERTD